MLQEQGDVSLNLDKVGNIKTLIEQAATKWGKKTAMVFDDFDENLI